MANVLVVLRAGGPAIQVDLVSFAVVPNASLVNYDFLMLSTTLQLVVSALTDTVYSGRNGLLMTPRRNNPRARPRLQKSTVERQMNFAIVTFENSALSFGETPNLRPAIIELEPGVFVFPVSLQNFSLPLFGNLRFAFNGIANGRIFDPHTPPARATCRLVFFFYQNRNATGPMLGSLDIGWARDFDGEVPWFIRYHFDFGPLKNNPAQYAARIYGYAGPKDTTAQTTHPKVLKLDFPVRSMLVARGNHGQLGFPGFAFNGTVQRAEAF